jgi:hypothetical protein
MCWETDYQFWAEQRKAETQKKQEERAGIIKDLLNEANKIKHALAAYQALPSTSRSRRSSDYIRGCFLQFCRDR